MALLSLNKNIWMVTLQNINSPLEDSKFMSFDIYFNKSDVSQVQAVERTSHHSDFPTREAIKVICILYGRQWRPLAQRIKRGQSQVGETNTVGYGGRIYISVFC